MKTSRLFTALPLLAFLALSPIPLLARDGDAPAAASAKTLRDMPYVTDGHARQKLDLYLPAQAHAPLLVYIHGGAWRAGSKSQVPGIGLVSQGFALASVEYRFSQDAIFPAQIEDCKSAIRWLRAHATDYGYDPARVAAFGDSAGGHLTALLATTGNVRDFDKGENMDQSSAIRCGIDFYGPTDFPGFQPPNAEPLVQRSGAGSALVQLFGGPLAEKMDLAKRASPVAWVTKSAAPLYILHGTKDPLVPVQQSTELAEKLKEAGVEVLIDVLDGAGHGGPQFVSGDKPQKMIDFLNRHLAAEASKQ
jgi:acetyl esterase/lipase